MDTVETIASNLKGPASTQNEKLYNVEGIFNPRLAKAQKKRRKKALKKNVDKDENSGSDYDFDVDYTENGDAEVEPMVGIQ
jgi:nuclear GTP-binding protein